MSKLVPHIDHSIPYSGHVPAELLGGPLCGTMGMVDTATTCLTATSAETGEKIVYVPTDLLTSTGSRVFQLQQEIPF